MKKTVKIESSKMPKSGVLGSFIWSLARLEISAEGLLLSPPEEVDKLIDTGRQARNVLTISLAGAGLAVAYGVDEDTGDHELSSAGWMIKNASEVIHTIGDLEMALQELKEGALWPIEESLSREHVEICNLFWLLPMTPNEEIFEDEKSLLAAERIKDWSAQYADSEATSISGYSALVENAAHSGEAGDQIYRAVRLIGEWSALSTELQGVHNHIDCLQYIRDKAA